jgi:hypothetical protein
MQVVVGVEEEQVQLDNLVDQEQVQFQQMQQLTQVLVVEVVVVLVLPLMEEPVDQEL